MSNARHLHVLGATGAIRTAMHEGREHIVVPVVALMEGVIHAINAETPEFVPFKTLAHQPERWNGFPAVLNHPSRNGVQISAKEPGVLDAQGLGTIFKTCTRGKKLCLEAWIDPVKTAKVPGGSRFLERVKRGEQIEVSVGAYVTTLKTAGVHNGRPYKAQWQSIEPDHIAFLPDGVGACSLEMGCGAHRAAAMNTTHLITAQGYETLAEDEKPVTQKSLKERLSSLLRAAGSVYDTPEESASEEIAELVKYKTVKDTLTNLGKTYDSVAKLVNELIEAEATHATGTDETAETEIEAAKLSAIRSMCLNMYSSINAIMDITNPSEIYGDTFSQRHMAGKRNSAADQTIIQHVHDHAVSLGANCKEVKAMRSACGCQHKEGNHDMKNKAERIKALMEHTHNPIKDVKVLEAASEEVLTALETSAESAKESATKLAAAEAAKTAAETAKATAEAALKTAQEAPVSVDRLPAEIKTIVEQHNLRTAEEKTELVASLKTAAANVYTEDELNAMGNDQLKKLAALAHIEQPAPKNYGGNGIPRTPPQGENFAPPDPYAAGLQVLQGAKK